ncbi:hypothetical protein [Rathayibacter tritici]|uniref:hypothetical protein n=1 Tax=Rathayibacter tritici TaxID=33888 RepID=UPI00083326D2|nr:hypothetical protein [Rathayibacter tritici]PPF27411.1 hypothetical protein C5C06_09655 [Rathayibacter tritici]PPI19256.1 hypothetical protein C5D07_02135 [Rathayibacter tritici]PPI48053.1 hypothetical protein C5D18_02080 [Rathayibacter tritici]
MAADHPFWIRLARKEPQCATVRGRVFEIGAPDERDGAFLLTVWEKGRPVGHVLNVDPPAYKPCAPHHPAEPHPVNGVEALLDLLVPQRTPLLPPSSPSR